MLAPAYGGSWKENDGTGGVCFDDGGAAFPFSKSRKLIEDGVGAGQSITSFFDVLPTILRLKRGSVITGWCRSLIRAFRRPA